MTANNISNIPNSGFTLYANGGSTASVNSGDMVTLAWSGNNVNTPGNCQASGAPDGGWSGSKTNPPATYTLNPALTNNTSSPITKTFTITCDKIGGGTVSSSATVTVDVINPSSVNIGISPMCTNTPSTRYYLAFRTTSGFTGTTSCTGGYWPAIPTNLPVISPAVSGSTYNISCSDNAGHNATVAGNIPPSCDNPCDPSTDPA